MVERKTIQDFIAGDVKAFERLFKEYARAMQLTALGFLRDADVAEDAVQESFVYLWNHREEINPELSLEGYLHTSVRHYMLNYIRHRNIRLSHEEEIIREQERWGQPDEEDMEETETKLKLIHSVIDTLPESCRKIFVMAVIEGMTYSDTAEKLGVSVNTVKSQVKIAYKKLKNSALEFIDNMHFTILFLFSLKEIL